MMKRTHLFPVLIAALLALSLPQVSVQAADMAEVCHRPDSVVSEEPDWRHLTVNAKSLSRHIAHGDGIPGGEVPGSEGGLVFDASCHPEPGVQGDGGAPPEGSAEVVFAIAYIDVDGDREFDSGDVLVSKLVDGPSPHDDGVAGPGDLIVTDGYPTDFGVSATAGFGATEHTVTGLLPQPTGCLASTATGSFGWTASSTIENYEERTTSTGAMSFFRDAISGGSDALVANAGSPSAPSLVVSLGLTDTSDGSFLEVEVGCSP